MFDYGITSTEEGSSNSNTTGTTSTATNSGTTTTNSGITKDYSDESFPSFTFSINNEVIQLPRIKSSKPRIVADVREIESGFTSRSYSHSVVDSSSIIELEDGNKFIMLSFQNEERDLIEQKNSLYNICVKTVEINKYRENYLHNYNIIRKLEVFI